VDPRFYKNAGPLALSDLVSGMGIEGIEGRLGDEPITRVAPLDRSQPGDLCFLESKKHLHLLEHAKASACFATAEVAPELGRRSIIPLITDSPKAQFARAVERLFSQCDGGDPNIHETARVHPTAYIGPGVSIGARTRVGPYAVIEFADIGEDCEIKAHACIGGNGLGVAADSDGMLSIFHVGTVRLGDRVRVGAQSCIDRAMIGETVLEDDVKLDNLVQIAHNCHIGARTVMASLVGISGSCTVGSDVRIGGQVGLADHLCVGNGATLMAQSGFMHDVPAGESWMGSPAQPLRQYMREVATLRKLTKPKKPS